MATNTTDTTNTTVATNATTADNATEVFRFMDLPPEIRDQIYGVILCTWPPPKPGVNERQHIASIAGGLTHYHRKIDFGIALANHRLWHDAFNVFMKQNRLIKVSMNGRLAQQLLRQNHVPIVAFGSQVPSSFKGYVMSHSIQLHVHPISPNVGVLILWRDLDCFCQGLAGSSIPFRSAKHKITIANPFANTSTPNYLNPMNQARLLQPYRKQLRGFLSFEVTGNVEPGLAESTMQEVSQYPSYSPKDVLHDMLERYELGLEYVKRGNNSMAYETWDGAAMKLSTLARTNQIWNRMQEKAGIEWSAHLAEIYFHLNYNKLKSIVRVLGQPKEEKAPMKHLDRYFSSLESALVDAIVSFNRHATGWHLTDTQKAKCFYQVAIGHRLARGDTSIAGRYIGVAALLVPDDPVIKQERENVVRWARNRPSSEPRYEHVPPPMMWIWT